MSQIPTPALNQPVSSNPLAKHFRQPAIYAKLTSAGAFWPEGAVDLPVTGKIPVYPMTTKDEITLKTPDALIDGTSVVNVIQSCCPNIKNAWEMPSVDVDSTLIAIRIASYGNEMTLETKCPHCSSENDYAVNLSNVLDQIRMPDYSQPVRINAEISVKLKPMSYLEVSRAGSAAYEEQRYIQALSDQGQMPEAEIKQRYNEHLERLLNLTVDNVVACTESIIMNSVDVITDPKFIKEYYTNAESTVLKTIQAKIKEHANTIAIQPMDVECPECQTQYKLNIEFDYASFFDRGF